MTNLFSIFKPRPTAETTRLTYKEILKLGKPRIRLNELEPGTWVCSDGYCSGYAPTPAEAYKLFSELRCQAFNAAAAKAMIAAAKEAS